MPCWQRLACTGGVFTGLASTFLHTAGNVRIGVPNEKLASDTIWSSTVRSRENVAEGTVHRLLSIELGRACERPPERVVA